MAEKPKYTYAVSPHEVYVTWDRHDPSIARFDIGVANRTSDDFVCGQIVFEVEGLTEDPGRVVCSSSQPDEWEIAPIESNPGQFRALPVVPNDGLAAGTSVSFQLNSVVIDGELGLGRIRVVEVLEAHRGETTLEINKIRGDLSIVSFRASAYTILFGDEVDLIWKTVFATRCELDPNPDRVPIELTGSVTVRPRETTPFSLIAYGSFGQIDSDQKIVTVHPRIVDFRAPESGEHSYRYTGEPVRLEWEVEGALERILSSDRRAATIELDAKGNIELPYLGYEVEAFTLTCRSQGGLSVKNVTKVWQNPGPDLIRRITAEPASVEPGGSTKISVAVIEWGPTASRVRLLVNTYPSPENPIGAWSEVVVDDGEWNRDHEVVFQHSRRQDHTTCYVATYSMSMHGGWTEHREQLIVSME